MLKLKFRLKTDGAAARRSSRVVVATGALVVAGLLCSPSTVSADRPTSYTVVAGDYLYGIAQRHKVPLADLLAANNLELTSLILPGQTLVLPEGARAPQTAPAAPTGAPAPSAAVASGATYTVVAGDYLYGIASKNRVRLNDLMAVNGLELTSVIHPGLVLSCPARRAARPPRRRRRLPRPNLLRPKLLRPAPNT